MEPWLWVKLVHVLIGAFWFGGAVVGTFYLTAAARALGPAAGPVIKYVIGVRKLSVALNIAAGLTVLTGLALYDRLSDHFRHPMFGTSYERFLTLGALTMKLTGAPTPEQATEIAGLHQRMHVGGVIAVILMVLALTGMALSHPI
jgi:hypothetical protein